MQRPPAISVQVVRSLRAGLLLLGSAVLFLMVPLYCWWLGVPLVRVSALLAVWSGCAVWLTYGWFNSPQGRLRWDGESWHWSGHSAPLRSIVIQYDFQTSLWLLLCPAEGRQFGLWLDACPSQRKDWYAIRRALVGAGGLEAHDSDLLTSGLRFTS